LNSSVTFKKTLPFTFNFSYLDLYQYLYFTTICLFFLSSPFLFLPHFSLLSPDGVVLQHFAEALSTATKLHIYCGRSQALQPLLLTDEHKKVSRLKCRHVCVCVCKCVCVRVLFWLRKLLTL